jgi:hypothetical protein
MEELVEMVLRSAVVDPVELRALKVHRYRVGEECKHESHLRKSTM